VKSPAGAESNPSKTVPLEPVATVRAFNRFWTKTIGVLNASLLDSEYSLTEVRVLFEITQRSATTLTELRDALGIDSGYLSRILSRLKSEKVIQAAPSDQDGRRQLLTVTTKGRSLMAELDERASDQMRQILGPLTRSDEEQLIAAIMAIQRIMDRQNPMERSFVIRPLRPGDIGWVLERHGTLYSAEYGFGEDFEALVARILADFSERRDPKMEAAWIAEVDHERAGSIFCMKRSKNIAQLRLLLVEPRARRMGIGTKLIDECISFASRVGYREMTLWTKDVLHDARRIYERFGFSLQSEDDPAAHGRPRGQTWHLALRRFGHVEA
jgi:DNA-binding MarR family transcriptional regulator/predicted N-acetyltransferase YhbS